MQRVFALHDSKAKVFGNPFFMPHVGQAVRNVQEAAKDSNSMLAKYPGDFTLFELGQYDEFTGVLVAAPTLVNHGLVSSLIEVKP